MKRLPEPVIAIAVLLGCAGNLLGQTPANLETRLTRTPLAELVQQVVTRGNPRRGGLIFFRSATACVHCHSDGSDAASPLGPALTAIGSEVTDQQIIESILQPSKVIKQGFESLQVLTVDGQVLSGLRVGERNGQLVLRDASDLSRELVIDKQRIEQVNPSPVSMMPTGLVAALREERDFYDLVRYVGEVARGGAARADELRPAPGLLAIKDDTASLDHAGILSGLDETDLEKGRQIYFSHCVNCHGQDGNTPTLATARAFGTDPLKFGADPLKMLGTLTRGNGLMAPMQHLSPKERYQVIHFIRQQFMAKSNPQYRPIDADYLASLPKGTDSGDFLSAGDRDFGPVLASQLGVQVNSALTFRLPGVTVSYDLHRFRLGGVWSGGFLDLSATQHYRQRGEGMPKPTGTPLAGLDAYAWELGGTFDLGGEDKPPRGPVAGELARYRGHYLYDNRAVLSYTIGGRGVLEAITSERIDSTPIVQHTYHIEPGDQPLRLAVAQHSGDARPMPTETLRHEPTIAFVATLPVDRYAAQANANQPIDIVGDQQASELDLGITGRTIVVRFKTEADGTLIASAPAGGQWVPDGKTLFMRDGRLVFDIGWVGAISGRTRVVDNQWHTAAVVVTELQTRLYVDGRHEGAKEKFHRDPVAGHILKLGATATNFGGDFRGELGWATIYDEALSESAIGKLSKGDAATDTAALWSWNADDRRFASDSCEGASEPTNEPLSVGLALDGDVDGLSWELKGERWVLTIPPLQDARVFRLRRAALTASQHASFLVHARKTWTRRPIDPLDCTQGGPTRWPQRLTMVGELGEAINGYALDRLPVPFKNPWNAWLRTSALDFFDDGRCVVTTHGGDVYLVSGIDDQLQQVTWKRYAAGLFEPFGVRVVDELIYVICRDGIHRLHDFDGNDEADFVEAFWIDDDVSSMFHAYNFDLQTDSQGNFYFAKAGQYTHHHRPGTVMKVPPTGGTAEVFAWGLRTPNGMGKLADDRFTVSDNQGPWMPAGKISLVQPDSFYGNMPINEAQEDWLRSRHGGELPKTFDEPLIWMPQELDNSCGGQVWAGDPRWGPLSGRLIHSSFGKGWLYYLSLQEVGDATQASIVALPHQWDAGVMRLRINPRDGQMYGVGLSGWQGPQGGHDGCLQRLRYNGQPVRMIQRTRVVPEGIEVAFNFALSPGATDPTSWEAQMWDYRWSRNYGSDQYSVVNPGRKGRDQLAIERIELSQDRRTVTLVTPQLAPCDQVRLRVDCHDATGAPFGETIHLTIHGIPEQSRLE